MANDNGKREPGKSSFALVGDLFDWAARPGYTERLGADYSVGSAVNQNGTIPLDTDAAVNLSTFRIPGVMQVHFSPTYGVSNDKSSYLNKASDRVFRIIQTALRQRNLPYQAVDVTIVSAALGSLLVLYYYGQRIFAASQSANRHSKYFYEAVTNACGGNYADWVAHRAEVIPQYITWAKELNTINIPNTMNLFNVHYEMVTRVYYDSISNKSQMYVCVPDLVYSYEVVDTVKGLTPVLIDSNITWEGYRNLMDRLIRAVKDSKDFDIISAGLASAYEGTGYYEWKIPSVDQKIEVWEDANFLTSLTNATPLMVDYNSLRVYDSRANYALCRPRVYANDRDNGTIITPAHIFNTITDAPTSKDMVNYSRWHVVIDTGDRVDSAKTVALLTCGTEIITRITNVPLFEDADTGYKYFSYDEEGVTALSFAEYTQNAALSTLSPLRSAIELAIFQSFKWAPIQWRYLTNSEGAAYVPFAQWNFPFVYGEYDIISCHNAWLDAAFLPSSGTNVPTVSTSSSTMQTDVQSKSGKPGKDGATK